MGRNIKLSFSLLLLLLFTGCVQKPFPKFPEFSEEPTLNLEWIDIEHGGVKGHFLGQRMWQETQEALINRRVKANSCIAAGKIHNKARTP